MIVKLIAVFALFWVLLGLAPDASAQSLGSACTRNGQVRATPDASSLMVCMDGVWRLNAGNQTGLTLGAACTPDGTLGSTSAGAVAICSGGVWTKHSALTDIQARTLHTMRTPQNPGDVCDQEQDHYAFDAEGNGLFCRDNEWISLISVDLAPSAFSFLNQSGALLNTTVTSNTVTLYNFEEAVNAVCGTNCIAIAKNGVWGGTTVTGFLPGDTIAIRMTSASTGGSAKSATVTVGTLTSAPWVVTTIYPPAAPPAMAASGITRTQIIWNWGASTGASGYFWGTTTEATTDKATATTHTETGLSCGTSYTRYVRASGLGGKGPYTTLTAQTSACPDISPNSFSLVMINANPSTVTVSDTITPTGYDTPAPVSVSGDGSPQVSIAGGAWATSGTISPGQTIAVRLTSSATFGASLSATVNIGGTDNTFTVTTRAQDSQPNAFAFTNQTGVALGSTITSNTVSLSGFDGPVAAVCGTGCTAIARNGVWGSTTVNGFVNGDTIAIRQTSSGSYTTTTTASVSVGLTTSSTWSVTSRGLDTAPTAFSFTNQYSVARSSTVTSNAVTLSGFDGPLSASCSGCTAIARNGIWGSTSVSGFNPGDTIAIRRTASSSYSTTVTASVTVGSTTSSTWSITTESEPLAYCATSTRTWGSYSCTASVSSGYTGDTRYATDSTQVGVGTATYVCSSSGTWSLSSSTCNRCTGGFGGSAYVDRYPDLASCYADYGCRVNACQSNGYSASCTKTQFGDSHYFGSNGQNNFGQAEGRCYQ